MVKKVNVKVNAEQMAIASSNGIAPNTVYARLKNGWDLHRAITEPPRKLPQLAKLSRNEEGSLVTDKPKGKKRSFSFDADLDPLVDEMIAASGMTFTDWLNQMVREKLTPAQKTRRQ
jgi:hypothetical protein